MIAKPVSKQLSLRILSACVLFFGLAGSTQQLTAQLEIEPFVPRGDRAILLDDLRGMGRSGSVSLTTSTDRDGVRTTKGSSSEDGQFEIRVDPSGEIAVTMTREYGVEDADKLMESHPELYMYLKAIPTEVGDCKIKIKIEVTTTIEADDEAALKEKDEDAFDLFERYGKDSGMRVFRGRFEMAAPRPGLRRGEIPRLEMAPMGSARRPGARDEDEDAPSITLRVDEEGNAKVVENDNKDNDKDADEENDDKKDDDN